MQRIWRELRIIGQRLATIEGEHALLWMAFAIQTWRSATFSRPTPASGFADLARVAGLWWVWAALGIGIFQLVAVIAGWHRIRTAALVSDILIAMAVAVGVLLRNPRSIIGAWALIMLVLAFLELGYRQRERRQQ